MPDQTANVAAMRRLLALLDPADWFVIVAACAAIAWLQVTKTAPGDKVAVAAIPVVAPAPPTPPAPTAPLGTAPTAPADGSDIRTVPLHLGKVDAGVARAYDIDFSKGDYYGAFALGTGGSYGWSQGLATAAAANTAALWQCAQVSRECRIVGNLSPALPDTGLTGPEANLNFWQVSAYRDIKAASGPRAFVRSLDGNWGSAHGRDAANAMAIAQTVCTDRQTQFPVQPHMPCVVVATWDK